MRDASSRGPAKAKPFLEDIIQIGEDGYARRNNRLTQIMQPHLRDHIKAAYAFLQADTPFCSPAGRVRQLVPRNPFDGLPGSLQVAFQRAPLHALLVSRSYITHVEAMSTFPQLMVAAAQAFSQWIESWVAQDFPAFRERSRTVSAQSWATIHGTMVRDPDGRGEPWLQVFANHPAVGNIMGWPREVRPLLQQPLCSLPVLAVATVLDVGALWLYDRQLRRITPVRGKCPWHLVGSKQLSRIKGDDALGGVTEVLVSVAEGDDNVATDARHTLDALDLGLVVEAQCGGQRLVVASARSPGQAMIDIIWEIVQDDGWRLLAGGKPSLPAIWWRGPGYSSTSREIGRTCKARPGVHVGRGEAEPAP